MILLATLLAAQALSSGDADMKSATTEAIVAGGKVCLGSVADPAVFDTRLAGWSDMAPAQKAKFNAQGRALTRDNVMIAYKPGVDGGCVVMAQPAPGFDKAALLASLSAAAGTPIGSDPGNPVTMLPNGELMVVQISQDAGNAGVMLVVASQKNSHVKKPQSQPAQPEPQGK